MSTSLIPGTKLRTASNRPLSGPPVNTAHRINLTLNLEHLFSREKPTDSRGWQCRLDSDLSLSICYLVLVSVSHSR